MAVLGTDAAGLLSVAIPDPKGVLHTYALRPGPIGLDRFALTLEHAGGCYRVSLSYRGVWACTCPHFRHKRRTCKHVVHAKQLYGFVTALEMQHDYDHPGETTRPDPRQRSQAAAAGAAVSANGAA